MLSELFHLRYLLLWKAATRTHVRLVFFFAYHAILLLSATMAFNSAIAISLMQIDGDAQFRILGVSIWTVYCGTIASAIFVGIGGEGTFSAAALRRYPLSTCQRQFYSHLLTMSTPVWIGCLVFSIACALTLSLSSIHSLVWRLPAAAAFFCASYLSAGVLASLVRAIITKKTWLVAAAAMFTVLLVAARAAA